MTGTPPHSFKEPSATIGTAWRYAVISGCKIPASDFGADENAYTP